MFAFLIFTRHFQNVSSGCRLSLRFTISPLRSEISYLSTRIIVRRRNPFNVLAYRYDCIRFHFLNFFVILDQFSINTSVDRFATYFYWKPLTLKPNVFDLIQSYDKKLSLSYWLIKHFEILGLINNRFRYTYTIVLLIFSRMAWC